MMEAHSSTYQLFDQTRQIRSRFSEIWNQPAINSQETVRKVVKIAGLAFFALGTFSIEAFIALPLLILNVFVQLVNGKSELVQRRDVALRALESSQAILAGDFLPYLRHRYEQSVYRRQQVVDDLDCLIWARQLRDTGLANRIESRLARMQREIEADANIVG